MSRLSDYRIAIWIMVWIIAAFVASGTALAQGHRDDGFKRAREVHRRHTERLCATREVEGTAVGLDEEDRPVIHVFLDRPGVSGMPKTLDGIDVQPIVTGKFYALAPGRFKMPSFNFWYYSRPVPIGISTGNEWEISAGTIACRVTDGSNVYALSNSHVFALEGVAPLGTEILQPGLYDTGGKYNPDYVIGELAAVAPIEFSEKANNTIDAAMALTSTDLLGKATPAGGYGTPRSATLAAAVKQSVQKYGRTTKMTMGRVYAINATVKVTYDSGVARFVNQILITPGSFSAAGDSGSLVVYAGMGGSNGKPIGLLFAGSSSFTVANPIDPVLDYFGVTVDGR